MTTIVSPGPGTRPSQAPADPAELDLVTAAFEGAPFGMYVTEEDGTVLRVNDAFSRALGVPREELVGACIFDRVPSEERAMFRAAHGALFTDGQDVGHDWYAVRPDGSRITLREQAWSHTRKGGARVRIASVEDVTRIRGLEARDRLFRTTMRSLPVIYYALDKDGRYVDADGAGLINLGVDPQSLVGTDIMPTIKGTEAEGLILRGLAGEEYQSSLSYPMPDGNGSLYYQAFYIPLRNAAGRPDGLIGLSFDVTKDRRTEIELRDKLRVIEEQKGAMVLLERILNSAPLLVSSMDQDGTVTLSEGKGLELLGQAPGESVGKNALEMFTDEAYLSACVRALAGEEMRVTATLAPDVWFDGWFLPNRAANGEVHGLTVFAVDSSERMRAENDLREKLQLIERQSATIRALATPIIKVWKEVLCLPVIGTVDSSRTAEMMDALLSAIVKDQARFAVIDLTGVEIVDTSTADHIIQLFRAANVLGVEGILCGIRPAVAQTVVALGVDLTAIRTMRTLEDALRFCIRAGAAIDAERAGPGGPARARKAPPREGVAPTLPQPGRTGSGRRR